MSDSGKCVICNGTKKYLGHDCTFCNGTGEWNQASENYLKDHICQCIVLDRQFCPVCDKKCHHDSHQTPKQRIDPGYGGLSATISIEPNQGFSVTTSDGQTIEEEFITV